MDKPADLTADSTEPQKAHLLAREKSNRICLLSMKRSIQEHLKSGLPADYTAKQMMEALEARNRVSPNAEIGTHLHALFNMRYDGSGGVRDYVLRMVDLQTKLKALNIYIPNACIVHQALNTLPPDFGISVLQQHTRQLNKTVSKMLRCDSSMRYTSKTI